MPRFERSKWLRPYQFFHHQQNWLDLEFSPYKQQPAHPYLPGELPSTLQVATWNVDSNGPHCAQRLLYLLDTLSIHFPLRPGRRREDPLAIGPAVICLQEIADTAVPALLAHGWVRNYFTVIGADPHHSWPEGARFGSVILLSRAVPLNAAYAYPYYSSSGQGRRAMIVDVLVQGPEGAEVLRIANAHLESFGDQTGTRNLQARELANCLRQPGLVGGILAGDLNVLSNADAANLDLAGFVDAWNGELPDHTWWPRRSAVRAGRETNYPPGRLDRIMTTGSRAVEVKRSVTRIGLDNRLPRTLEELSDHCGLYCEFRFRPRYMRI